MPITAEVCVIVVAPLASARAMPKSMTLTWPVWVSMTLPGLMSRWMMPCRWLNSRAEQMSADDLQRPPRHQPALGRQHLLEGAAVDELHDDVGQLFAGRAALLAGVVDGDDRRVVERGRVLRLAAEPQLEGRVPGEVVRSVLIATSRPSRRSRPRCTSAMPP